MNCGGAHRRRQARTLHEPCVTRGQSVTTDSGSWYWPSVALPAEVGACHSEVGGVCPRSGVRGFLFTVYETLTDLPCFVEY